MPNRSKLKIFLADDMSSRLTSCKHQLQNMGYPAVFSFASPDACLRRLPLRPDLVLLPCPVKSPEGIRLQRIIRAYDPHTMVMYLGDAPETHLETAMRRVEKACSYRRIKEAVVARVKSFITALFPGKR